MSVAQDLHMHTTFCDGESTPEEMVLSAISKGFERVGVCIHSPVSFDSGYFPADEGEYARFREEMARLKKKYADRIEVLCGLELDIFSSLDTAGFDYIIGSVHYVEADGAYFAVDDTPEKLIAGCEKHFGGDYIAMAERYFETVAEVVEKTSCDIIGHFDLIAKFNDGGRLFDEHDPRYVAACKAAADKLLESGKPFELNTGGISRAWRSVPYPAPHIAEYIKANGGRLILSSDAHTAETVAFEFDKFKHLCTE